MSFSLDPMLSAYWPDPHVPTAERWFISRWLERFNHWFDRQAEGYKRLIGWALTYRWLMVALATVAFAASIALPAFGIVGGSFFPPAGCIRVQRHHRVAAGIEPRVHQAVRIVLDPLAILLSLPLSLIGVMLALWMTGSTLNLMSMIGVILLMGIVAKNAILLIDFAKSAEARGMPRKAAIVEAGRVRLRPILMTTFALIVGMIPVAIGSGAARPRGDRRRHHVHDSDAAGDSCGVRHPERVA